MKYVLFESFFLDEVKDYKIYHNRYNNVTQSTIRLQYYNNVQTTYI